MSKIYNLHIGHVHIQVHTSVWIYILCITDAFGITAGRSSSEVFLVNIIVISISVLSVLDGVQLHAASLPCSCSNKEYEAGKTEVGSLFSSSDQHPIAVVTDEANLIWYNYYGTYVVYIMPHSVCA